MITRFNKNCKYSLLSQKNYFSVNSLIISLVGINLLWISAEFPQKLLVAAVFILATAPLGSQPCSCCTRK